MRAHLVIAAGCLLGAALAASPAAAAPPAYHLGREYAIGGEGGWDYLTVDPDTHRLYYGRSTRVQVLDLESGKVVGEIADTPGIHGVALAPALGRGFSSNGRDSSVTIFDLKSLAVIAKVRIEARNPDAILYEPVTKRVFTFNGGSGTATAIDAAAGTVIGNVTLGGRPEFAVADGKGRVFVNLEDSSVVTSFDAKTLELGGKWPLAPGEGPSGLAIDVAHRRLFSVCGNAKMVVLDADSGHQVAVLDIGRGVDAAGFDPGIRLAFASNGDGTLSVVREDSPDRFSKVADVATRRGARTMALDPRTHRIYTATARFGEPPAPTADRPHPRPPMLPDSFVILTLEP
jgi:DNA-binding beta-propeller fold protein YncE